MKPTMQQQQIHTATTTPTTTATKTPITAANTAITTAYNICSMNNYTS
jgi:hypothetical protein